MDVIWILVAAGVLFLSGLPALLLGAKSRAGMAIGAILNVLASALGFAGLVSFGLAGGAEGTWSWQWALPLGRFAVGIDAMGVVFLIPIFLISALGSIYGLSYWPQRRHPGNGQRLRACWGLLAGSMAMIVLARDAILFLMAWEVMALSAYMLVATEDHKQQVRQAAWVYLVATHLGTLCLLGFFALLHAATGSWAIWETGAEAMHLNGGQAMPLTALPLTAMLILALLGFGMKAGIFPLHVWLPGAHANAPSHVSAVLSGVMLKMGVYGLFRATALVPPPAHPPAWWGGVVLALGVLSALVGIVYAVGQQDYKRMLAYSSIENMGIIMMGLGLALLGQASGQQTWVVLGMGAALFHVLNHSLFKPLLFMGAGSLLHGVHTRRIDRLGGLAKRMPLTFVLFVVGSIAICGLPPLNGFASELLLYLGLLDTARMPVGAAGSAWGWAALGVPALAAVGALAVAGFVKLLGCVFQGEARTAELPQAHDPPPGMWMPMILLGVLCVGIGCFPALVLPMLERAIGQWDISVAMVKLDAITPLGWLTWAGVALVGGIGAVGMFVAMLMMRRERGRSGTWDCGYARPSARMQYTAASFAQMVLDLVAWALWPRGGRVRLQALFARRMRFSLELPDVILDRALVPGFRVLRDGLLFVRQIQRGSVQAYIVYVLVIIVLLILLG